MSIDSNISYKFDSTDYSDSQAINIGGDGVPRPGLSLQAREGELIIENFFFKPVVVVATQEGRGGTRIISRPIEPVSNRERLSGWMSLQKVHLTGLKILVPTP